MFTANIRLPTVRFWKSNREQALLCMFLQENNVDRRPMWGDSVLCVCVLGCAACMGKLEVNIGCFSLFLFPTF